MLNEFHKNLLNSLNDAIYFVDKNKKIVFWNKQAEEITGYKSQEVLGKKCSHDILNHVTAEGEKLCLRECPIQNTLESLKENELNAYINHKDGHRIKVFIKTIPFVNESNIIIGTAEVFRREKPVVNKIKTTALDEVTSLPNREYLNILLKRKYEEYKTLDMNFGVVMISIDNYEKIYARYGKEFADKLLTTLSNTFRYSIVNSDIIGRWTKSKFMMILSDISEVYINDIASTVSILVQESCIRSDDTSIQLTSTLAADCIQSEDTLESFINRIDKTLEEKLKKNFKKNQK